MRFDYVLRLRYALLICACGKVQAELR